MPDETISNCKLKRTLLTQLLRKTNNFGKVACTGDYFTNFFRITAPVLGKFNDRT